METPKVCIIVCKGSLSELIVKETLKELGGDVALCPLDEISTGKEDTNGTTKKAKYVMVVDACSDECSKKRADALGVSYDEYLNLGNELGLKMPCFRKPSVEVVDDVGLAATYLVERVKKILAKV